MKEQIAAIAAAATSNDTTALQSFKAQGVVLSKAGSAAVEPVVEAVRKGRVEEAKVMWSALSEMGAALDSTDAQGRTAVWMAAMRREVEVVKVLREMGATGETPPSRVRKIDINFYTAGVGRGGV